MKVLLFICTGGSNEHVNEEIAKKVRNNSLLRKSYFLSTQHPFKFIYVFLYAYVYVYNGTNNTVEQSYII